MMESSEKNFRRSADQEFIESLHQLENILHEAKNQPEQKSDPTPTPEGGSTVGSSKDQSNQGDGGEIDLAVWEDAVADIEQYLERQAQEES